MSRFEGRSPLPFRSIHSMQMPYPSNLPVEGFIYMRRLGIPTPIISSDPSHSLSSCPSIGHPVSTSCSYRPTRTYIRSSRTLTRTTVSNLDKSKSTEWLPRSRLTGVQLPRSAHSNHALFSLRHRPSRTRGPCRVNSQSQSSSVQCP